MVAPKAFVSVAAVILGESLPAGGGHATPLGAVVGPKAFFGEAGIDFVRAQRRLARLLLAVLPEPLKTLREVQIW